MSEKITIENTVAAPLSRVWVAYTSPDEITKWNFASDDWHCPEASVDLREGGVYKARMAAKDESFAFDFKGIFREVTTEQALTIELEDGRRSRTVFIETPAGTQIVTEFDAEGEMSIEAQRDGWQAILDNFRSYVEAHLT